MYMNWTHGSHHQYGGPIQKAIPNIKLAVKNLQDVFVTMFLTWASALALARSTGPLASLAPCDQE